MLHTLLLRVPLLQTDHQSISANFLASLFTLSYLLFQQMKCGSHVAENDCHLFAWVQKWIFQSDPPVEGKAREIGGRRENRYTTSESTLSLATGY